MPKVLISDELSEAAVNIFKTRGIEVDFQPQLGPDAAKLKEIIGNYDGLAIRSATKVKPDIIAAAQNLKVIGRAGIGVDNVDIPAATAKGMIVMNTPFGNSITTAEHAIALMFAAGASDSGRRRLDPGRQVGEEPLHGREITGKTLGLIGCGNIGSIVADRALGLKMKVIAYDPFLSAERAVQLGVEKVELEELLPRADVISLHVPMTDKTKNILSREALAKTKKGVIIINAARGGLVDEAALREALESEHVAAAGFDVFTIEPAKENVLFGAPNVHRDAAPRRFDQRSAGECGATGGRADERLFAHRRGDERAQHAVDHGRRSAALEAVRGAGGKARRVRGTDHR
jgi:D-3-phosphoglycerate dehydrogenase